METAPTIVVLNRDELLSLIEEAVTRALHTAPTTQSPTSIESLRKGLSFGQVCGLLNVSAPTLRKMLQSGTLHGARTGSKWIIAVNEVERFLREAQ